MTVNHDFGKPLKTFTKVANEYKERDMLEEASNELCKVLELTDRATAILACRKFLVKFSDYQVIHGKSPVIRIT